jgi:hypothetical protein
VDAEVLFIKTLEELERRAQPENEAYDILMVSALLRKLLTDGLTEAANRDRRIKIRYVANDYPNLASVLPPSAGVTFWSLQDGFDPETSDIVRPVEVSRDGLLARPVMTVLGEQVTVKDVVRYLANKAGGVHLSGPDDSKQRALAELDSTMELGGTPPVIRTLLAISRVVLRGLEPLRVQIANNLGSTLT